jgi:hypothetical protein
VSSFHFDPANYGAAAALVAQPRLAPLGPGSPDESMRPKIEALKLAPLCLAGLWLYFDFLDESHRLSQDIETPDGNFWHAIMHRREPDADNSKYWWQRVGSHPVLTQLRVQSLALGYRFTSAPAFVDLCERVRYTGTAEEEQARHVQLLEWQLLYDWCWRGGSEPATT